jgi:hydroquinone glucosyltransferase
MPGSDNGGGVAPHVVIITVPCPGHIIPSTQLAKCLMARGVKVSCFSTGINYASVEENLGEEFNHERIRFRPLISPAEFVSPGKDLRDNIDWMQRLSDGAMAVRLEGVVRSLHPPPACIVTDLLVGWAQDVADKLAIPRHVLFTMPANALLFAFACVPGLLSPHAAPLHPPGTWNSMVDSSHFFHDYMIRNTLRLPEADMILVNTFEALEQSFLSLMRDDLIGKGNSAQVGQTPHSSSPPLSLQIDNHGYNADVRLWCDQIRRILSIGPLIRSADCEFGGLGKREEDGCCAEVFEWLDAQEEMSVLYVSFGSLLTVTETQIHELAHGLEVCGRPFLWVYRAPDSPQVLPSEVEDRPLFDGLPTGV